MSGKFIKGLMAGAVVGAVIGMTFDPMSDRNRRQMKMKTGKIIKMASTFFDNMMS